MPIEQILIVVAQCIVFIVNAIIYARQKSALDVEKRDRGAFGVQVGDALRHATEAERLTRELRLDNYESLRIKFEEVVTENGRLRARISSLEESVATLQNKLASRERTERKIAREDSQPVALDSVPRPGPQTLDELARQGVVVPLSPPSNPPPPATNNFRRFGGGKG